MNTINGPFMTREQIDKYLSRIEMEYPDSLDLEYLKRLQYAHISHIPFENIDIMNGTGLKIDRIYLFDKVIERKEGGVCSELNTLYNWLLESLGFDVKSYISRIIARSVPIQATSHRVMVVSFGDGRYITDVGFNYDHHRIPILIKEGLEQYDGACTYRLDRDEFLGWVMNQKTAEGWRGKLSFYESPCIDLDFVGPTFFAENHPSSRINKALKVSIHKDGKFYAIREGMFLIEEEGIVRELERLDSKERERELLHDFFGLNKQGDMENGENGSVRSNR